MFFFVLLFSGIFTSCMHATIYLTEALIKEAVAANERNKAAERRKKEEKIEAKIGRKMAVNEYLSSDGLKFESRRSFDSKAEDRLARRTSSLEGEVPVDISPYIFHSESFAVMNNEIQNCKLMIPNIRLGASKSKNGNIQKSGTLAEELDITVTFNLNKNQYKYDESILIFYAKANNKYVRNYLKYQSVNYYYANKFNVRQSDLKNFDVKINNTRNSKEISFCSYNKNSYIFDYFVYDTEPCYYMFDVEVEYQKTAASKEQPAVYETINKVYRSDYSSLVGAAFDVHTAISDDIKDLNPIINFVKVVKYPL